MAVKTRGYRSEKATQTGRLPSKDVTRKEGIPKGEEYST
jgi:hypothetical protein